MPDQSSEQLLEMSLQELWELFPIVLQSHNPQYKEWYAAERQSILKTVGMNNVARINHIGSTAVEGLLAKPTIDILLEIVKACNTAQLSENLLQEGWLLMSENSDPLSLVFNKGYTLHGFAEKVFHLHVRHLGDWDELYFRDYLIAHPDVAMVYGDLKRNLLEEFEHNRDGYTKAKSEFILKHTGTARQEFSERYLIIK